MEKYATNAVLHRTCFTAVFHVVNLFIYIYIYIYTCYQLLKLALSAIVQGV